MAKIPAFHLPKVLDLTKCNNAVIFLRFIWHLYLNFWKITSFGMCFCVRTNCVMPKTASIEAYSNVMSK